MKIGQLARAAGCHAQSIRHYESLGLLPRSRRTPTGHRRYGQEDLARVLRLRQARDQGLSLPQIRELLQADGATPPAAAPT